ncbi:MULTISPECIES: response regulator [Kordiimonas]|uniref:response regulator n=1 Tax=Kordiimonas TaxID=288021 RepID=UPI001FF23EAD|nr:MULTISPECIES: response regulator transcription factor [Kordiimonas]MCK0069448.1 response regulator transcription factor [Kordiimonas laminariae]UTW58801.1 response regulator transcription factor [Kordiimonas sp. SCSIO 12603]
MTEETEISLIIVDDHALVRRGLSLLLENSPGINIIGEAENGEDAVKLAAETAPDVILLDLFLPDISGVEAARRIKELTPRSQILMLTSHEGDEYLTDAMQAGVLSYLIKESDPDDLIAAIHKANKGEATLSPRLARALMKHLSRAGNHDNPLHESLTQREHEVLRAIANGDSNQTIASNFGISEKTVKSHVTNILSKLYLNDRTQAAVYAWRNDLVSNNS